MADTRRLVVDVLKPHEPSIVEITDSLAELDGVDGVNSSLIEVDEDVKNIKVTVEGRFQVSDVRDMLEQKGASVHSVDKVAAGEKLIDEVSILQD